MNPPDSHLDLLTRPLFAHFATVASDCSPRVNPMWFLWDAEPGVFKRALVRLYQKVHKVWK